MTDEEYEMRNCMCHLCGLPNSASPLVRLAGINRREDSNGHWHEDFVAAITPKNNNYVICEGCIRGLKRLPFSEIEKGKRAPLPKPPRRRKPPVPPEEDIPF